jgi:Holliday junction DNA helicase RuvB
MFVEFIPLDILVLLVGYLGTLTVTALVFRLAPEIEQSLVGRLLLLAGRAMTVALLTLTLFGLTVMVYLLMVSVALGRAILVGGHRVSVQVGTVPRLPVPTALPPLALPRRTRAEAPPGCYDMPNLTTVPVEGPVDTNADIALVGQLVEATTEFPHWADALAHMVEYEKEHEFSGPMEGWEWYQVITQPGIINQLIVRGLVRVVYNSRKYTQYRLTSLSDTEEALEMLRDVSKPTGGGTPPDVGSLFSLVVGHDRAKLVLSSALLAAEPVHVLLYGPPGSAKSLLVGDVARLPDAESYVGATTTKSGLVGLLVQKRPRYLILDELDKMNNSDMTPLLNLMEGGVVSVLQHKRQQRVTMDTRVFATANDLDRIPPPIRSRMAKVEIPAYAPPEFIEVARAILVQREGLGPQQAQLVATEVVRYTLDVRDAVRVGRMVKGRPLALPEILLALFPQGARLSAIRRE